MPDANKRLEYENFIFQECINEIYIHYIGCPQTESRGNEEFNRWDWEGDDNEVLYFSSWTWNSGTT